MCLSVDVFANELTDCLSVDVFANELTDCLSVDEFSSELTNCLSIDIFTIELNNCLSIDEFASERGEFKDRRISSNILTFIDFAFLFGITSLVSLELVRLSHFNISSGKLTK